MLVGRQTPRDRMAALSNGCLAQRSCQRENKCGINMPLPVTAVNEKNTQESDTNFSTTRGRQGLRQINLYILLLLLLPQFL